MNEF
jgi:hypothetical protein